jgi:hypothetical protein
MSFGIGSMVLSPSKGYSVFACYFSFSDIPETACSPFDPTVMKTVEYTL